MKSTVIAGILGIGILVGGITGWKLGYRQAEADGQANLQKAVDDALKNGLKKWPWQDHQGK